MLPRGGLESSAGLITAVKYICKVTKQMVTLDKGQG